MAVKRASSAAAEIAVLNMFKMHENRPVCIPEIVYEALDKSEFGITPVGKPLVPGSFSQSAQVRGVVMDVHMPLCWLHDRGFVHRDVRCDNVIVDQQGRGVPIDFDSVCEFRRGSLRIWRGSYICCPPRLIREVHAHGWLRTYAASGSDDWYAFVLFVNCPLAPTRRNRVDSGERSRQHGVQSAAQDLSFPDRTGLSCYYITRDMVRGADSHQYLSQPTVLQSQITRKRETHRRKQNRKCDLRWGSRR